MQSKKTVLSVVAIAGSALLGATSGVAAHAAPPTGAVIDRSADSLRTSVPSSEELIRAMYFGQGSFARELADKPGFWYLKDVVGANPDAEQGRAIDTIVSRMRADNPTAFDRTAREMTSGDPYRVADEMRRLNRSFEMAVRAVADAQESDPFASDATIASPVVVVAVVFHAGVAVTGVAVGVVAVAVANSVVWHNQVKVTSRADRPGGEQRFLADVTASLAG